MRRIIQKKKILISLVALTLVLSACSSSSSKTASNANTKATDGVLAAYDATKAGGTLTLLARAAGGTLDPHINYTLQYWQIYQATYDGLLAFRKVDGPKSFEIVPDLAEAMPVMSNGGKTLTFTLRKGIMFSDGREVSVADVKASYERIFSIKKPY